MRVARNFYFRDYNLNIPLLIMQYHLDDIDKPIFKQRGSVYCPFARFKPSLPVDFKITHLRKDPHS